MDAHTIRREALLLPAGLRAELAEDLLSSLDELTDAQVEQLWFDEAARRADDIDSGKARRFASDEVRREAQALLK